MRKHAAPSDVVQLAAARSRIDPVSGTTYDAIAETMNSTQPARLIDGHVPPPALARSAAATR